jgi:hypothetical protein
MGSCSHDALVLFKRGEEVARREVFLGEEGEMIVFVNSGFIYI